MLKNVRKSGNCSDKVFIDFEEVIKDLPVQLDYKRYLEANGLTNVFNWLYHKRYVAHNGRYNTKTLYKHKKHLKGYLSMKSEEYRLLSDRL